MKKLNILLFVLTANYFFAQTYHFDYYLDYTNEIEINNDVSKRQRQFLVNSKMYGYEMDFEKVNNKMRARILDFNNDVSHFFEVKSVDFPLKNEDFVYLYSVKTESTKKQFEAEFKKRFFSAELIREENGVYQYAIKEYRNERLKRATSNANVELVKFDADLSSFALKYLLDYHEIHKKLKLDGNYIVKSAKNKFGEAQVKINLEAAEPQNLNITVDSLNAKILE